jgi:hypothetical protein
MDLDQSSLMGVRYWPRWECDYSPNGLYRKGWRRDSIKPREEISVEGFMACINMRRQQGSSFPWDAEWALGSSLRLALAADPSRN